MSYYQVAGVSAEFDRLQNTQMLFEIPSFRDQNREVFQRSIGQNREGVDISYLKKLEASRLILDRSINHQSESSINHQAFGLSSESFRAMQVPDHEDLFVIHVHCLASKILSKLFKWRNPTDEEKEIDLFASKNVSFHKRVVIAELCLPAISIIAAVEMIAYATLTYTLSYVPIRFHGVPNFFPLFASSAKTRVWSISAMVYDNFARMSLETNENDFYKRFAKWCNF